MSIDFDTFKFDDEEDNNVFGDTPVSFGLVELLGTCTTGIHIFYGMHTEMRRDLISNPEKLLQFAKEQLEGKNIRGHYIVEITKVTHCPYDRVVIGYGTSGINLQIILEYKYRIIKKDIMFVVKASADHVDKFTSYGDDIPIYGETNKEILGFMISKNRNPGAKKLINLAANEYGKKGLAFPSVIYSFEMRARDRNITVITQPLLPTKPLTFRLLDEPKFEVWDHLAAKIELLECDYPEKLQSMLGLYSDIDVNAFGFKRGMVFMYDKIGATMSNNVSDPSKAVGIDWVTFMDLVHSSYVSIYNLWNHYRRDKSFAKDKYLVEFERSKMNF